MIQRVAVIPASVEGSVICAERKKMRLSSIVTAESAHLFTLIYVSPRLSVGENEFQVEEF
jgi:hypothetical protein